MWYKPKKIEFVRIKKQRISEKEIKLSLLFLTVYVLFFFPYETKTTNFDSNFSFLLCYTYKCMWLVLKNGQFTGENEKKKFLETFE